MRRLKQENYVFNIMLVDILQPALSRFYYLIFLRNYLWKTQKSLDKFIMFTPGLSIRRRVSVLACAIAATTLKSLNLKSLPFSLYKSLGILSRPLGFRPLT
jgi:hypothetical protein